MANPSIYAAFERMWQHVLLKLKEYALLEDIDEYIDNAISESSQVQIITWEAED